MLHRFDAKTAQCFVFTFREGLLSAAGHDLQLRATEFAIEVDDETRAIEARFAADSLRVVGAIRGGQLARTTLRAQDKHEIESNISRYVLQPEKFPEIHFVSSGIDDKRGSFLVKGTLAMHGRRRSIKVTVRREEKAYAAECTLHQPDFGIAPYSALLGTLRIAPEVKVQVRVPMP